MFGDHFIMLLGCLGGHLEVILAPLGSSGGPLGSKFLPGPSLDPPRTLQESLLEPPGADFGPNLSQLGANLGPTWANLRPTWTNLRQHKANLEPTWAQVGPKLPPESHLERSWGHLEASWGMWGKRSQILLKNNGILFKNRWKSTPKISKIHYYSRSKCIFVFFEKRPQKCRFLDHLEAVLSQL